MKKQENHLRVFFFVVFYENKHLCTSRPQYKSLLQQLASLRNCWSLMEEKSKEGHLSSNSGKEVCQVSDYRFITEINNFVYAGTTNNCEL